VSSRSRLPLSIAPDPHADDDLVQEPPHDIEAEQAVLGAVMLAPTTLAELRPLVDESVFYRSLHAQIWRAITSLADRGAAYDAIAASGVLRKSLRALGDASYLHTLIAAVTTTVNAGYHARRLCELAYARRVIETGTRLVQLGQQAPDLDDTEDLRTRVAAACATITAPDVRGWPEPSPLSAAGELPAFPLWALPGWLGDYCAALAEVTQTPPDLAGCLALAVLSVAAAGHVWVQAPTWTEPANIFTVVVLPPGSRKSEVFAHMTAPIRTAESCLAERAQPAIIEARLARRMAEAEAERTAAKAAAVADPLQQAAALAEASAAALTLERITVPAEPVLFTVDSSVEKLASLLAEQGGRFAVLGPEGKIFSIMGGRYSKTPDLQVFLSGHAGEEMRIDRIGRPSERIEAATLTLGVCIQPGVLARLGDTPEFREQGLLGRILYALPDSMLGHRKENPAPIPIPIQQTYTANVSTLVLSLHELIAERERPRHTLRFTPDAREEITRLLAQTEPRFRPGGDLHHMTDWGGKLVGATVRIAGLLHLATHLKDGRGRPITGDTFAAACQIGDYFTHHAQAAYYAIGADPAVADARALLDWARRTATTRFTAREVLSSVRRFKTVADVEPALRLLESHGWLRRLPRATPTGRGRPAAPTYELHPEIVA
jgi:replicative DNA helicase